MTQARLLFAGQLHSYYGVTVAVLKEKICSPAIFVVVGFVLLFLGFAVRRTPFFMRYVCCVLRLVSFVACMLARHMVGCAHACIRWVVGGPFCPLPLPSLLFLSFFSLSLLLGLSHSEPFEQFSDLTTGIPGQSAMAFSRGIGDILRYLRGFGLYAVGCCWPDPLLSLVFYGWITPFSTYDSYAVASGIWATCCRLLSGLFRGDPRLTLYV